VHRWLSGESYWAAGRTRDVVDRSFAASLGVGVYDGGTQVGVARVVTDRATFGRGLEYADTGAVIDVGLREAPLRLLGRVQGSQRNPYICTAVITQGESGTVTSLRGACTCPVMINCKHVFAMAIVGLRQMPELRTALDRDRAITAGNTSAAGDALPMFPPIVPLFLMGGAPT